jgi:hypothetical protein
MEDTSKLNLFWMNTCVGDKKASVTGNTGMDLIHNTVQDQRGRGIDHIKIACLS